MLEQRSTADLERERGKLRDELHAELNALGELLTRVDKQRKLVAEAADRLSTLPDFGRTDSASGPKSEWKAAPLSFLKDFRLQTTSPPELGFSIYGWEGNQFLLHPLDVDVAAGAKHTFSPEVIGVRVTASLEDPKANPVRCRIQCVPSSDLDATSVFADQVGAGAASEWHVLRGGETQDISILDLPPKRNCHLVFAVQMLDPTQHYHFATIKWSDIQFLTAPSS